MIIINKNNNFLKTLSLSILTLATFLLTPKIATAAVRCEIQYGGQEVCVKTGQLQINKKVCDPNIGACDINKVNTENFVDNIPSTRHLFAPNAEILFRIEIKNVGDVNFSKITVEDTLPLHLKAVDSLSWDLKDLAPNQTQVKYLRAKVANVSEFGTINAICELNQAEAKADNGENDKDMTQVCMERTGKALKVLPKAGALSSVALFAISLLTGTLGFLLVKKSKV